MRRYARTTCFALVAMLLVPPIAAAVLHAWLAPAPVAAFAAALLPGFCL